MSKENAYSKLMNGKPRMGEDDKAFLIIPLAKSKDKSLTLLGNLKEEPTRQNFEKFIFHFTACLSGVNRIDYPQDEADIDDVLCYSLYEAICDAKKQSLELITKSDDEIQYKYIPMFLDFIGDLKK